MGKTTNPDHGGEQMIDTLNGEAYFVSVAPPAFIAPFLRNGKEPSNL